MAPSKPATSAARQARSRSHAMASDSESTSEKMRRFEPLAHARRQSGIDSDIEMMAALPGSSTSSASTAAAPPTTAAGAAPTLSLERVPTYLQPDMPLRERLQHFTFAWYTVTMSTSGVALVLGITPHRFSGLNHIGLAIFLLDLLFFLFISLALSCRFILYPRSFSRAFCRPAEALFAATGLLSVSALLSSAGVYGRLYFPDSGDYGIRHGLFSFLEATFWIYLAVSFLYAVFQYHVLFTVKPERRLAIHAMTPGWILPIFPVMLAGTLAGVVSPDLSPSHALPVLAAGLAAQGLGFLVSVFMYATYLSRLMAYGLPIQRPGMFIAVGPPSFTCVAFIAIAADLPRALLTTDLTPTLSVLLANSPFSADVSADASSSALFILVSLIRLGALAASIFLWGLSFWFFAQAAAAVVAGMPDRRFHLSWWSFVFPNAGLTLATIRIGDAVQSSGVLWLASAMSICIVVAWLFIGFRCIRAVIRREIVWPGHDEDKD